MLLRFSHFCCLLESQVSHELDTLQVPAAKLSALPSGSRLSRSTLWARSAAASVGKCRGL